MWYISNTYKCSWFLCIKDKLSTYLLEHFIFFFLRKKRKARWVSYISRVLGQNPEISLCYIERREKQFSWATKWSPSFLNELFSYKIIENQIEFSSSGERIWINFSICGIIPSVSWWNDAVHWEQSCHTPSDLWMFA